ncbi:MAG: Flp pilus assembly protein CpaB [Pseudomonadota bacterium]
MLRYLLLAIAIAAGGTAAWLVEAVQPTEANANSSAEAITPMPTTEILVAAVDLPAGTALKPQDLRWQVWPTEATHPTFIKYSAKPTAPGDLAGMVLRVPILAGTPVIENQVGDTQSGFLSGVLTPGMRAVAIPVSAERTAGGFILPNNRVDVLLAAGCEVTSTDCTNGVKVQTILQNVRVLAIDQSGTDPDEGATLVGRTATLELSPKDAEVIVAAEAAGRLSLVLRASEDEAIVDLGGVAPVPAATEPAAEAPAPVADAAKTIRVLRGGVPQFYDIK